MPTYTVTVNGTTYEVTIEDPFASPVVAKVNGQRYVAEVTGGQARLQPTTAAAAPAVSAAQPTPRTEAAAAAPVANEAATITAQMPGKVLAVAVKAGDQVRPGDEVLTMEAMKMAMAVRSPAGGVVREVRVSAGQAVKFGEVLLVVG
ncbi:MAG: biotin/lipoyl-binding protein [Chloroflexi bacterium]|nr:biotin/lipoyl-binding protein [Chloroflexota bacterium]